MAKNLPKKGPIKLKFRPNLFVFYLIVYMTQTYRDSKIDQRARSTRAHVERIFEGSQTIIRGLDVFEKEKTE